MLSTVIRRIRANSPVSPGPVALLALAVLLTGCVYRINVQQGNLLDEEAIEQVEPGMTRSQVQFLLGTPTVADTFHDQRWDYPYYFVQGRSDEVRRRWIVVHFDGDRVTRVERGLEEPEEVPDTTF